MEFVSNILQLGPTVVMPIIFFVLGLVFKLSLGKAFKAAMTVGVGFEGLMLMVTMFLNSLGPVTAAMVKRLGVELTIMDAGWATSASVAWSSPLVPFVVAGAIVLNIVLLACKKTKILNIDMFNYWLILIVGTLIYTDTGSILLGTMGSLVLYLVAFKIGDWTARDLQTSYNMQGVAFIHPTCGICVPFGIAVNALLEKLPGLRDINLSQEKIVNKLGILGEPVTLATILGAGLGVLAGWRPGQCCVLAVKMAAVMLILPKMIGILMEGVMLVRDSAEAILKTRFPGRQFYIGMDTSLLIGEPSVLATGLLLIPITLLLAVVLPGNRMLPFADLSVLVYFITMLAPYCQKNIFRMLVTGTILMALALYISTDLTAIYTTAVHQSSVVLPENMRTTQLGNMLSPVNTPVGWLLIKLAHIFGK